MVKHVVCFKLKEEYKKNAEEIASTLLSMRGKVPSAKQINVGLDELGSQRSYDVYLEVILDDFNALEVYQNDEYHAGVIKPYMRERTSQSVSVDFTL